MLRPMTTPPADLAKRSEITRFSGRFDAATKDIGDLRVHASADGKRQYLRVWETTQDGKQMARWYEAIEPEADPNTTK